MVKTTRAVPIEDDAVDRAIAEAMAANPPRNLHHQMRSLQSLPWRTSAVQRASSLEKWIQWHIDRVQPRSGDDWARLGCDSGAIGFLVKVRMAILLQ